ncbi:transposase [Gemmobacter serpentinus]|uniref:transposase n=1 Tax=Gemmobacter serpentinus TaxID=2652247 RepID=UPI00124EEE9F|nr:transposase [Gemmobacter serpentinus]
MGFVSTMILTRLDENIMGLQAVRLRHIKGIGPVVSATLIAQLPKRGDLDRRRIAALAGLAPHANDPGHRHGKRCIWGGRGTVRRTLYLAALTASRFDPRFRAFKELLLAAGKARKLLTVLSEMMRTGTTYQGDICRNTVASQESEPLANPARFNPAVVDDCPSLLKV